MFRNGDDNLTHWRTFTAAKSPKVTMTSTSAAVKHDRIKVEIVYILDEL
jgi:hypothetical protein